MNEESDSGEEIRKRTHNLSQKPSILDPTSNIICEICCQSVVGNLLEGLQVPRFADCAHTACKKCWIQQINRCIKLKQTISCFEPDCPAELSFEGTLFTTLPHSVKISIREHIRWQFSIQLCSKKGCLLSSKQKKCFKGFCENCCQKAHPNCRPEQFELPQNVKVCPNCFEGVEKLEDTCLRIHCRCKHEFCFKCLRPWNLSHHACGGINELILLPKRSFLQFFGLGCCFGKKPKPQLAQK